MYACTEQDLTSKKSMFVIVFAIIVMIVSLYYAPYIILM